jgi:hypothetical protein
VGPANSEETQVRDLAVVRFSQCSTPMLWDMWKQGFTAWEQATAQYMEKLLSNPSVLGSSGTVLTAAMKTKAATERAMSAWWASIGLPTRRDQERALHKLNQLESRLYDLEEQLAAEK